MHELTFVVAGNENLASDLCRELHASRKMNSAGTFDLIVGVNTTRYAHRLNRENELARDIFELLRPAGQTIMIDMNRYFPFFRSRVKRRVRKTRLRNLYSKPEGIYASVQGHRLRDQRIA